ncbi:hypothetical protein DEO72_LG10g2825 [Vigna unguiculata]|uniref:Uncharacterized protein n=1 Tax=Vigna unguiculata TaxID=3917 RepID=A0A4D6NFA1_VIGUN|nr:hypothetical protein DEO72_LG10g2825 [Vigna unguiculata]
MPFIVPISRVPPTFLLVCQWGDGRVLNYRNVPHDDLVGYWARIDDMQQNQNNLDLKCVGGTTPEIGVDHGVELDTTTVIKRTKM